MTLPLPPGPRALPLIGETIAFTRDPGAFAASRHERYGRIFRTHLFGSPAVFIKGADGNRWVFAGEYRYVKNRWTPAIRKLLGARSTSMLEGDAHKARRKLIAPHFARTELESMTAWMDALVAEHLARWERSSSPIELTSRIKALAFEIAARFLVGELPADEREQLSRDFDEWVAGLFALLPLPIPGTTFARADAAGRRMMSLFRRLVRERQQRRPDADAPVDVLGTLLRSTDEHGRALDVETIAEELQLFFFAGHDTTVTSTTNAMIHLAQHPEVLERAREEQARLGSGPITAARARQAQWLTQTIQESMRVIPPIGGAFRVTIEEVDFGGEYRIPEGWAIVIAPRSTHYDADAFEDPDAFDPSRFGEDRLEHKRTPLSWIPFGGGPRLCIGQHFAMLEMQVMLSRLIRDYRWELVDPSPKYSALPFPRPVDGGRVRFSRRPDSGARSVVAP